MKYPKNNQIHVIVKYFYPVAAGIETNILETYSVLAKMGWDVTIHTSKDTLTEKNVLSDYDTIKNLKIRRYEYKWYGFIPKIRWGKTDLISLHNFNVFPQTLILIYSLFKKIIGKKNYGLILTPHGGFNPEWRIFSKQAALIKKIYHFTVGTFLINSTVDGVRAVSEWEKNEMISKGIKSQVITVIDNGIEDEAYQDLEALASPQIKEMVHNYGKYLIQIGRIYKIKNYETVIKTLPKISKEIKYVIVGPIGSVEYKKSLEKLIEELKLKDRVIFTGVIRGIDKYYLIKNALMMVHMALWESFCNVVHEGLSQGLICIVADNTALPFLIKDGINGYCVKTQDSEALAEKINYVLNNLETPEMNSMREKNRIYGLENSWKKVAEKMDLFYDSVIDKILNK